MKENFTEQIRKVVVAAIDKYGSAYAVYKKTGISQTNLGRWKTGASCPRSEDVSPIMELMGAEIVMPGEHFVEYDYVPKVAATAGAGSSLETSDEVEGMYAFRKDFMVAQHINAKNCILLDVRGDSMEPLIKSGDMILVDTTDKEVQDGKTYLVAYGDDLRVKHIFKSPQGLILRSENQRYADITIRPDELGSYAVVHGRVRWFARMM